MVDGYHASGTPTANTLIALDASAHLRVPQLIDSDNTLFLLNPTGFSNLDWVFGQHFGVNALSETAGYYVEDTAGNDIDYGLYAENPDSAGVYVTGSGDDGIHVNYAADDGVEIWSAGNDGIHVNDASDDGIEITNANYGVYVPNSTYYGVWSYGDTAGGYFWDGDESSLYSYIAYGTSTTDYGILSNGTKSFVQQHPTDPSQSIIYSALEGGEAGTYYRGTAQLVDGTARVDLPEHFGLVTEEEGLTVQVTPRDDCNGLFVEEVSTTYLVVRELMGGSSDARFDFLINGVRAGFRDFAVQVDTSELFAEAPLRDRKAEVPEEAEEPDVQPVPAPQAPDDLQPPDLADGTGTEGGGTHDD
jgi:hypothetical protein